MSAGESEAPTAGTGRQLSGDPYPLPTSVTHRDAAPAARHAPGGPVVTVRVRYRAYRLEGTLQQSGKPESGPATGPDPDGGRL
ncbi:hypothetical protein GCM10027294_37640 [Marinactinospora endophytica]